MKSQQSASCFSAQRCRLRGLQNARHVHAPTQCLQLGLRELIGMENFDQFWFFIFFCVFIADPLPSASARAHQSQNKECDEKTFLTHRVLSVLVRQSSCSHAIGEIAFHAIGSGLFNQAVNVGFKARALAVELA